METVLSAISEKRGMRRRSRIKDHGKKEERKEQKREGSPVIGKKNRLPNTTYEGVA